MKMSKPASVYLMFISLFLLPLVFLAGCTSSKTTSSTSSAYYMQLLAGQYSIPADGTSTTVLTANVQTLSGTKVTDGTIVHFATTQGNFLVTGTSATQTSDVSTSGGQASVELQSTSTANEASVTASAGGLSNTVFIQFTTTSTGTGTTTSTGTGTTTSTGTTSTTFAASNLTATATEIRVWPFNPYKTILTLTASNAAGSPVSNGTIATFTINNNPGGCKFISSSGSSLGTSFTAAISSGTASAILNSGTHSGVALVTAAYTTGGQQFTNSVWIVVDAGPVAGGMHFGIAVAQPNVRGLTCYGESDKISVYLSDRYSNPVPDGTPVYFSSRGGQIDPIAYTTDGQASTTLYSSILPQIYLIPWPSDISLYSNVFDTLETANPFTTVAQVPQNGWNEVIAYTYGEEYFVDSNQNGIHDSGEPVVHQGDPWLDANADGMWDPFSIWYNTNDGTACSTFAGGCFTDTITGIGPFESNITNKVGDEWYWPSTTGAPYSAPALDPTNSEWFSQTAVWNHIIVLYSGYPAVSWYPTTATLNTTTTTSQNFLVYVGDINGNPLTPGSSISASLQGLTGASVYPSSVDVHATTWVSFNVSTSSTAQSGSGYLVLSLTTPNIGCVGGTILYPIQITIQ